MEELQNKYDILASDSEDKAKQLLIRQKKMEEKDEVIMSKQTEYILNKAAIIKVIDKLKKIIKNHVPCFNLYGYSEFGLD